MTIKVTGLEGPVNQYSHPQQPLQQGPGLVQIKLGKIGIKEGPNALSDHDLYFSPKRYRTLIITRDGSRIPKETTPHSLCDHPHPLLPMKLIAGVVINPNHHVQLTAVNTSPSDILLQSKQKLKEAIRTHLPTATVFQDEVQVAQVVIHNVRSFEDAPTQIMVEVASLICGITLPCAPGCISKSEQWAGMQHSSMVLSHMKPHDQNSTEWPSPV